jgi:CHAT domain-containing protein/Flp pilus assembly protein TadD
MVSRLVRVRGWAVPMALLGGMIGVSMEGGLFAAAPVVAQTVDARKAEGDQLLQQGQQQFQVSQFTAAVQSWQQALVLYRKIKNRRGESYALGNLGVTYQFLGNYTKAIEYLEQTLAIAKESKDQRGEGTALGNLGNSYYSLGNYPKAIEYQEQTLAITREIKDRNGESRALSSLGLAYRVLGNPAKAIEYHQQSLAIAREIEDRKEESGILNNLGLTYQSLGNSAKAIEYHQQSLAIAQEIKDRLGEGRTLGNLGDAYYVLGHSAKAIEYHQQSLMIAREIKNRRGESSALASLGLAYRSLSNYAKAIEYHQQSLIIVKEIKDRRGEGNALGYLGINYDALSRYTNAIEYLEKSLAIMQEIKDRQGESTALGNLGRSYNALGNYAKAIEYQEKYLKITREIKDRLGEGNALDSLGLAHRVSGNPTKAIEYHQQSLAISREIKSRLGEGIALSGLGLAYKSLHNSAKAMEYSQQSLAIAQEIKNLDGESVVLNNIGSVLQQQQPELAIAFYKKSVNFSEDIRETITTLSRISQESYTQSVSDTYRNLTALLIQQNRLSEAQQVLELLKLRELKESNRNSSNTPEALKITLSPTEQNYLTQATAQLSKAASIPLAVQPQGTTFATTNLLNRSAQTLLAAQTQSALIYYLVHPDSLWILLATPDGKLQPFQIPLTAKTLRATVEQFRQQMEACERRTCTTADTASLNAISQKLHTWLMPQALQQALQQTQTRHLIFALDSVTRYLPMAALYDGQQYLVQRYTLSNIISTYLTNSQDRLPAKPTILGLGLSNAATVPVPTVDPNQPDRFPGLVNVPLELTGILGRPDKPGIYPGLPLLDQNFTLATLKQNLPKYNILHLATHGIFRAKNLDASYLVLGDGKPLTIPMIDAELPNLANIHLVVLSACQTGLGGANQDGVEISGISNAFLNKGVKAIAASLWQVNDGSTSLLMQQFYKTLATGTLTKAEALNQAQLSLLNGKVTAKDTIRANLTVPPSYRLAKGPPDFSHPYYWAPFILIGNSL